LQQIYPCAPWLIICFEKMRLISSDDEEIESSDEEDEGDMEVDE